MLYQSTQLAVANSEHIASYSRVGTTRSHPAGYGSVSEPAAVPPEAITALPARE